MTRDELVSKLDAARTARDVALAEVSATHNALVDEAEQALIDFDNAQGAEEEVEAAIEGTEPVVEGEVEEIEDLVVEDEEDDNSPSAEEEEILRRAAEIERKYQG